MNKIIGTIEDNSLEILVEMKDSGPRGEQGDDGYTPIKGTDYFDGIDGQDGSDANVTKTNVEAALGYKIVFYTEGQTIPSLPTDTIAFIREV